MSDTITDRRFVITVTIKSNEPGATPVDVTWYRGENHAEALAALVQAGARDIGDESMPERMRAVVQAVRMDIYPIEPLCSGRMPGNKSVPYCRDNPGGCAFHYPSERVEGATSSTDWPESPWKMGDPDPTPDRPEEMTYDVFYCTEPAPDTSARTCTWRVDGVDGYQHPAWHVSGNGRVITRVWPYRGWTKTDG